MSLPLLKGAKGWPQVLLARAADAEVADIAAAEAGGAWTAYRARPRELSPDGCHPHRSPSPACAAAAVPAIPPAPSGATAPPSPTRSATSWPTATRPIPGAQLDRALMERDPHAVVEGVAIAAWAIGAERGHHRGLVGRRRGRGTPAQRPSTRPRRPATSADVRRRSQPRSSRSARSPGAFVLGEETVLLRALEGKRGAAGPASAAIPPRAGLWGKPTVVNNVKTLAAVPWIVRHGADAFASLGSADAPGTTLVQLRGAVTRAGHRGGAARDHAARDPRRSRRRRATGALKAVLVGGPTGGFLPPDALDTPLDLRGAARGRRPRRLGLAAGRSTRAPASWTWPRC